MIIDQEGIIVTSSLHDGLIDNTVPLSLRYLQELNTET